MKALALTVPTAVIVFALNAASAQTGSCNGLLNKRITASGTISAIVEMDELYADLVFFKDIKTGCPIASLEGGGVPFECTKGRTINTSGLVTRWIPKLKAYEIDNGPGELGNATCR